MLKSETWEFKFKLVKSYYERYGNIDIPYNYKVNNINIGQWIRTQRKAYKNNTLSKDKIDKLEQIGMIWNDKKDYLWKKNYELAKKYYNKNGYVNMPYYYKVNNFNLGKWIITQRYYFKKGILSQERIDFLNKLKMKWS